jgi:serine/threonine protein kinase
MVQPTTANHCRPLLSRTRTPWRDIFPKASEESLSLLDRLLTFNVDNRITVEDELQHEFVPLWTRSDQGLRQHVFTRQTFMDCGDAEVNASVERKSNMTLAFCDHTVTFAR